jgi:hypothetical protein
VLVLFVYLKAASAAKSLPPGQIYIPQPAMVRLSRGS